MDIVKPWMRLKVNADTYYLPGDDGSVYFRNNLNSFRMEGSSIQSWVERILPVLDGQHSLASLTEGLSEPYRDRIYEITGILLGNGYVRDVSSDRTHQLPANVHEYYGQQIEFLDNLIGSGAFHFQTYRHRKVLAIGSDNVLLSLVGALWESGLASVNVAITDEESSLPQRLNEIANSWDDPELTPQVHNVDASSQGEDALRHVIAQMDAVLYVSETGDIRQLGLLESVCIDEHCLFIPAVCTGGLGIVGPMVWPDTNDRVTWDQTWRRLHTTVFDGQQSHLPTRMSRAILANVLTFELFKAMTGLTKEGKNPQVYTLNPQTLQGAWHSFVPALPRNEEVALSKIESDQRLAPQPAIVPVEDLFVYFTVLTDATCGIFHQWDEGDTKQLPLAQCRIQPADPNSDGPADLLAVTTSAGLTHEEARLEAGFSGIERYVERFARKFMTDDTLFIGVGTGANLEEAIWRGLHRCLVNELTLCVMHSPPVLQMLDVENIRDDKCNYYLKILSSLDTPPVLALGQALFGLPVVWAGMNGQFVGSVGISPAMALQRVLEYTIQQQTEDTGEEVDASFVVMTPNCVSQDTSPVTLQVEPWQGFRGGQQSLTPVLATFAQYGRQVDIFDLATEPFLREVLAGVVGVSIRKEAAR